jgi:hypothetical protein
LPPQTVQSPSTAYVTQDEFAAAITNLATAFTSHLTSSAATNQQVAANGNPDNPYGAGQRINTLTDVTITNPTISGLSASAIPDLSGTYLPLSGGTVSGTLNVSTLAASTTSYTNVVAASATTTNATSTTSFATTASSTNLFAQAAQIGSLTLGNLSGFLKATAGAVSTALVNLTSDVTGVLAVSNGGTGWASIASGYIPFGNGASALATSSNLYWDNTTGRLGIGTTSPATTLSVQGSGRFSGNLSIGSPWMDTLSGLGVYVSAQRSPAFVTVTPTGGTGSQVYSYEVIPVDSSGNFGSSNIGYVYTGVAWASLSGSVYNAISWSSVTGAVSYNVYRNLAPTGGTMGLIASGVSGTSFNDTGVAATGLIPLATLVVGNGGQLASTTGTAPLDPLQFESSGALNGMFNTFFGMDSGISNTTGNQNTFMGRRAGMSNTIGTQNTFIGSEAGTSNTTGYHNVFIGEETFNVSGNYDTYVGTDSGLAATGSTNTFIGSSAGATNTASADVIVGYDAGQKDTGGGNVFVGNSAGQFNDIGTGNTFLGYQSGQNATSSNNTLLGYRTGALITTGANNTASGYNDLTNDTTGGNNTAGGYQSLDNNTTASQNTAYGAFSLHNNTVGATNTAIGYTSLITATSTNGTTAIGYMTGENMSGATGAVGNNNTFLGYKTGYDVTTGGNNLILGTEQTIATGITTGSNNILIGNTVNAGLSPTGSNQLNIGNLIFGTSLGTGATVSSGSVGIGTTSPWRTLSVAGTVGFDGLTGAFGTGSLCLSSSKEVVYNAGSDSCLSSLRSTKHDINPLMVDAAAQVLALNPVSFIYNNDASSTVRYGFIAEDAAAVDSHLATYDQSGNLSGVDDRGLLAVIVKALQSLITKVDGFALNIVSEHVTATNADIGTANIDTANIKHLCVAKSDGSNVCVTGDQLSALLAGASASAAASANPTITADATSTPAVVQINGNNPAYINVGDSYGDLGATITGPQADLNLGIKTFLNGALVSNIVIDTSAVATDTIDYVVTDANGFAATSTRTVVVEAQAPLLTAESDAATNAATTTDATTTAQ